MTRHLLPFAARLAETPAEVDAALALRHQVFVEELGAEPSQPCQVPGRESDRYDDHSEHLILIDQLRGCEVVGVQRLMDERGAARAGGFATEEEFDIAPLRRAVRPLLEISRTCLSPRVRGGAALHVIWEALATVAAQRGTGVVFGLASLPGTDRAGLTDALAMLAAEHLAPPDLRPRSREAGVAPPQAFDRRRATLMLPPLVRGYLRMGGKVGAGAFVDRRFRCTDVCMVLDLAAAPPRQGGLPRLMRT